MLCFAKGRRDESLTFGSLKCDISSQIHVGQRSYEHVIEGNISSLD